MHKLAWVVAVMVVACGGSAKPPAPPPQIANQPAPEPAPAPAPVTATDGCGGSAYGGDSYGILGCTTLEDGGAFASLTGTGDISSGFDDNHVYGGLLGDEEGELQGGFGKSGFGEGGGGTGTGTIGTGRYGTIGHGSGTGSGYGTGGGRSVPTVRIGQPSATGDLDKAIIRRYIKRNIQKITYCYEKELVNDPKLSGTVRTEFVIAPTGLVSSSTAKGVHADVAACVAQVIAAIEFPKPKGGGTVQVNYPFTFRTDGD